MSDSFDSETSQEIEEVKNEQLCFVNLLEEHKTLFDKRMTPKIKSAKEEALKNLTDKFSRKIGKEMSTKQILKKFNNMKTKIEKIVNTKKTGNKNIKLHSWQKIFYNLWNKEENPVLHKIPGAANGGVGDEPDVEYQGKDNYFKNN